MHVKSSGEFFVGRSPLPLDSDPPESDSEPSDADDRSSDGPLRRLRRRLRRRRCRVLRLPDRSAGHGSNDRRPPTSAGDGDRDDGGRDNAADTDRSMGDSWTGGRSRRCRTAVTRSGDARPSSRPSFSPLPPTSSSSSSSSWSVDDRDERLQPVDRDGPRAGGLCMACKKNGPGGGNGNGGKNGDVQRNSSGRTACATATADVRPPSLFRSPATAELLLSASSRKRCLTSGHSCADGVPPGSDDGLP